jgi:hypothetical protein
LIRIPIPALDVATGADTGRRDTDSTERNPRSVLGCTVGGPVHHALIVSLHLALSGEIAFAGTRAGHQFPMQPIVNGHHVQPRADRLQAFGYSDLTQQQATEVDRLYQKLLQQTRPSQPSRLGD